MYDHQLTQKTKYIANSPESKQLTKNMSISPVSVQKQDSQKDKLSPGSFNQSTILQLQHTIGNKATVQLLLDTGAVRSLHPVQREARYGLEQMVSKGGSIQRQEGEEEELQMMPVAGVVQYQEGEEEDELQMKPAGGAIQRQEGEEEELQMMPASGVVQRQEGEEEQDLQMMPVSQRTEISNEEEKLQMKSENIFQRKEIEIPVKRIPKSFNNTINPLAVHPKINRPSLFQPPIQKKNDAIQERRENNTGMPDNLKSGLEALSGLSLSDVRVHRNSDKPPQVGALAYTQGIDIHVAPGQEQHLPHEGWHAVQQKQGRVQATTQAAGLPVNDESALENEADVMGEKALQMKALADRTNLQNQNDISENFAPASDIIQRTKWDWLEGKWQPRTPTSNQPPQKVGKYEGEYYDDGIKEKEESKAPPKYTLQYSFGTRKAYVKEDVTVNPNHMGAVVNAAYGESHKSKLIKGKGVNSDTPFIHPCKTDTTLYLFSLDGDHSDGIKMITITRQGSVSDKVHYF